ncbi:cytochrome bd ubiquinol oxidase subunit I [Actinomadura verrucosospora]|uniref:Cytochrome bd ubiquinol oxidase subunit I n=1 Tax=Actinomadura verrucosospora TaxID=46165 RepID=A0A7D3ZZR2_ACTVE|nr:cytochrome ubiquinol oxidase subunit I [Actinomadura verrucosospora]QKG19045.1 cytochrome bd ubiquinol oxidase subunit I [Actinomadura verrucosospora]
MDPLVLARVQFALTAGSHFLFVALTLGLATLVALMQTRATLSGSAVHARMTRFWGQLYVVNYAVGIVTGLVMEFQFGLNWAGMSRMTGGVFGAPLALETIGAFFVEATFLGLWIFGWDRLNRWVHLALIWVVTLTAYLSAYFVLVANGWLQRPVGYEMRDGAARLTDAGALLGNPTAVLAFGHVLFGGLLTAGFFMAGVSGYHLLRRTAEVEFFRRSMRIGLVTVIASVMPVVIVGGMQYQYLQPTKTGGGDAAGAVARFTARFGPDDYMPPGMAGAAEAVMEGIWSLMLLLALVALVKVWWGRWLVRGRVFHVVMICAVPLPYVAMLAGWVFREVGRQPWMVYGVLKTRDALSPGVGSGTITVSFVVFTALFAVLVAVNAWLLARFARRGPDGAALGAAPPVAPSAPAVSATF